MTVAATPIDLRGMLANLAQYLPDSDRIDTFSGKLAARPAQNTLILLGLATVLFHQAERHRNPRVHTLFDSLEFCASSLSVGYSTIYPQTPMGKTLASLLMTWGPALTNAIIDGPGSARHQPAQDPTQRQILATLEQILAQLKS